MTDAGDHGVPRERITLATRVTLFRILNIPVFLLLAIYYIDSAQEHSGVPNEYLRWAALMVFLVSAASDALDGYLARSRNERTRLGTLLDPLADKALLLSGLLVATGPWGRVFVPHIPIWYALLVVSRDVMLALGALLIHMVQGHTVVQPRILGKAATVFQMTIILWVLAGWPEAPFRGLLVMATGCTLVSGLQYLMDGIRQVERAHPHEPAH